MIRVAVVCLLVAACGAAPSPAAQSCIGRYQACGLTSKDMPSYIACRDAVDKDCLPAKGTP